MGQPAKSEPIVNNQDNTVSIEKLAQIAQITETQAAVIMFYLFDRYIADVIVEVHLPNGEIVTRPLADGILGDPAGTMYLFTLKKLA